MNSKAILYQLNDCIIDIGLCKNQNVDPRATVERIRSFLDLCLDSENIQNSVFAEQYNHLFLQGKEIDQIAYMMKEMNFNKEEILKTRYNLENNDSGFHIDFIESIQLVLSEIIAEIERNQL